MRPFLLLLILTLPLSAQWKTVTYQLQGGWNAIYLHGEAVHDTPDNLFASGDGLNIEEIWRWNPNPSQIQFTTDPFVPSPGTPEWSTWYRTPPGGQQGTLTALNGQTAYLVKCSGTAGTTYSVPLLQKILPPRASWVRNGANLLGFPAATGPAPAMGTYFATFPAATATNSKIYKYEGGPLGPANPIQVFSPAGESLDRNRAYWFEAEVSGSFYAPLEITTDSVGGISFGRTGSVVTLRLRNRSAATVTVTMTPGSSENTPGGTATTAVPLTLRTFNSGTGLYDETPIAGPLNQAIGPQASVEISLGIDRAAMTDPNALYASFLTLTDSGNLMEVDLPATAQLASLAGLWRGTVLVDQVSATALTIGAVAEIDNGVVTAVKLTSSGGRGYATVPAVTIAGPVSGTPATATATVEDGVVTGFTVTDGGSGYVTPPEVTVASPPLTGTSVSRPFPLRYLLHIDDAGVARLLSEVYVGTLAGSGEWGVCTTEGSLDPAALGSASRLVAAHLPLDQVLPGDGSVALGASVGWDMISNFDAETNPFVHRFHPDHDNLAPRGDALAAGVESYTLTRDLSFAFALNPPPGMSSTGWGATVLAGTYTETLSGPHKNDLVTGGSFTFRRINEVGTLTTP